MAAKNQSAGFVQQAMGLETAERDAELADSQIDGNPKAKRSRRSPGQARAGKASTIPKDWRADKFHIAHDTYWRLKLTAMQRGKEMSELVDQALRGYLPRSIRISHDKGDEGQIDKPSDKTGAAG